MGQKKNVSYVDSLLTLADNSSRRDADSLYMEVGHVLAYSDPLESIEYLEKSIMLSERSHRYKVLCMAHSYLGLAYGHIGIFDKAVQQFQNQLNVAKEHDVVDEVGRAYSDIGNILVSLKNYEIANIYLQEAKDYVERHHDYDIGQFVYSYIGRYMLATGQADSAIFYLNKTLRIRQSPPVDSMLLSETYRSIGDVYFREMDYPTAKYYYGICMTLADSTYSGMSAPINVNMALMYMYDRKLDSAFICAHQALYTALRFGDRIATNQVYGVLGNLYYGQQHYEEASMYFSLQIDSQDSIKNSNLAKKIYDMHYQKQIHDQQEGLRISKATTRLAIVLSSMMVVLVIGGVFFALRFRKRDRMLKDMNIQIEDQARQTTDSINYARKIQQAITPKLDSIGSRFADKFILFRPKLNVSGNFYWAHSNGDIDMIAICDSGESGVPGAFMSMLCSSILHDIADKDTDPSVLLVLMRAKVEQRLLKMKSPFRMAKGLDVSLAVINHADDTVSYSGVKFPLILSHNGELSPVGDCQDTNSFFSIAFTSHTESLSDGDCIYLMTRGYTIQKSPKGEEYSRNRLLDSLKEIQDQPMEDQKETLLKRFDQWRFSREQDHDLLIAGFRYRSSSKNPDSNQNPTQA